jgi:quercetin dioxygenase-like cupin family protein
MSKRDNMPEILIVDHQDLVSLAHHPAATCRVHGEALYAPAGAPARPLWAYRVLLGDGATMAWGEDHRDEVLLIGEGEADAGVRVGAGDAVIVERGVPFELTARGPCDVWHWGSSEEPSGLLGLPLDGEKEAYVVQNSDRAGREVLTEEGAMVAIRYWADSSRITNRLALFEVSGDGGHRAPSHSHSANEVICILDGTLRVGKNSLIPKMSIYIPSGYRYGYQAAGPYRFVNFRADASMVTTLPGEPPRLEVFKEPGALKDHFAKTE